MKGRRRENLETPMRENSLNDQIDVQGRQDRGGGKKEMASMMSPRFLV